MSDSEIKKLWQGQDDTAAPMPIAMLRQRALRFRTGVKIWLALELAVFAYVSFVLTRDFIAFSDPLRRLGVVLLLAGLAFALWQLAMRAFLKPLPADAVAATWLGFRRASLERQRDAFLSAWKWYVLPLLPGLLVFQVSRRIAHPHMLLIVFALDIIVCLWAVGWRFGIAAFLQRRIRAFDRQYQIPGDAS
jgi:hypothetical protein